MRLELYDDNGACCSTGSLRKVLTERDGVAVVYDYTFTNSFELAKKLSKEYAQLRGDATIQVVARSSTFLCYICTLAYTC